MAHRNMALGRLSRTTASTSITSSFVFRTRSVLFFLSFPLALASFFPNKAVVDVDGAISGDVGGIMVVLDPTADCWKSDPEKACTEEAIQAIRIAARKEIEKLFILPINLLSFSIVALIVCLLFGSVVAL